jgi:uncharacterized membrane protein
MVESNLDISKGQGHIVVCPNMSGQWQTTKLFLWLISSLVLFIATIFALLGLWVILPFAGIEIIALVSLMYWVTHQCRRKQVITLSDNRIFVEAGYTSPGSSWESELFFTRLFVDKPPYRDGKPVKVFLRGRQQQLEIGEFLNEEDKQKLITELRSVIIVVS